MNRSLRLLLSWWALSLLAASACQSAPSESPPPVTSATNVISEVDGMILVYIPAQEFLMGSDDSDPEAESDENPQHIVHLNDYWIDQTEVTNRMYEQCVGQGACTPPMHSPRYNAPAYIDHPIVGVTWFQAQEYCAWAGRRLPTEAEWEKAARGVIGQLYPCGTRPKRTC
ncbi:MAG: formylglycine-generating enzyme family protein [Chloroflexi bacterium]|nr:formylglycine-generating enzyme family protein [Chloroflexota bacterium]